ncbi:MAG: hypothetical protein NVS4B2_10630 [Chloroflexota bacterium]
MPRNAQEACRERKQPRRTRNIPNYVKCPTHLRRADHKNMVQTSDDCSLVWMYAGRT